MPGLISRDEEKRFPNLARRITLFGSWQMDVLPVFVVLWIVLLFGLTRLPLDQRKVVGPWLQPVFFAFFIPTFLMGLATQWRARGISSSLKGKGYKRFGPTLDIRRAVLILDPALLRRVPAFSEIEDTLYNNPNDPDALLRMLDDLAAQMEGRATATPPPSSEPH